MDFITYDRISLTGGKTVKKTWKPADTGKEIVRKDMFEPTVVNVQGLTAVDRLQALKSMAYDFQPGEEINYDQPPVGRSTKELVDLQEDVNTAKGSVNEKVLALRDDIDLAKRKEEIAKMTVEK